MVFKSVEKKIYDLQVQISTSAGEDPKMDLLRRGQIYGLVDLFDIEFEDAE